MRLLLAPRALAGRHPIGAELDLDQLATAYAPPAGAPNWLRVNMVATVDGAAQGPDGLSGTINTPADHIVFQMLRAVSDIVVIGAGTARAEGYAPLSMAAPYAGVRAAHGLADTLPLALVTASGNLPDRVLERAGHAGRDSAPVLAITAGSCPRLPWLLDTLGPEHVVVAGEHAVDLALAVRALQHKGFHRIHSEGGPSLLGALLAADLLDELDLTISPVAVGGTHKRIVSAGELARDFALQALVEQDGTLMGRWLRTRP